MKRKRPNKAELKYPQHERTSKIQLKTITKTNDNNQFHGQRVHICQFELMQIDLIDNGAFKLTVAGSRTSRNGNQKIIYMNAKA